MKKILLTTLSIFSFSTTVYAIPMITEPNPGQLDLTGQNANQTTNEWSEAHRQFLESIANWQNQNQSTVASYGTEQNLVQSVTGQLTQNQSIITDITNHQAENLMLYIHDMGYLHLFDNEARPNTRVTRADFAYMLGAFVKENNSLLNSHGFSNSRRNNVNFQDINSNHFAYENLMELTRRRIIHETSSNIRPDDNITRVEADRWIQNLFDLMNNNTTRQNTNIPTNNITRLEVAELIAGLELNLNNGPISHQGALNLVRANARNFTPQGFELQLTVNNASVSRGASVSYRIGETEATRPLNSLTPIATFAHNTVYSIFIPAEFPGVHTVFVNLTLGSESTPVNIVTANAVLGFSNFVHQLNPTQINNTQNFTSTNNWNWNNSWNDGWNWSGINWNDIRTHGHSSNQGDQWARTDHQFPGWNVPGNNGANNSSNRPFETNNIVFGDSLIEAEVRRQLNIQTGSVSSADARRIVDINITIPPGHSVSSNALRGLEHLTNLRHLRFSFIETNTSSNLRNLRNLENLTELHTIELRGHGINNLSHIIRLIRLQVLDLNMTQSIIDNNISYINYLNWNHNLTTWR